MGTSQRVLDRGFFDRDPRLVAPDLLGKLLVNGDTSGWIRETEAYLATGDPAAHAFRGRTNRTRILYGPPGHAYVYRTRQHCCLNVAVQGVDVPGCVLIRALVPVSGVDTMRRRRGGVPDARLADGPAKLCQAMAIDMRHYGVDLTAGGPLRIAEGLSEVCFHITPRIGITKAADWPLRYLVVSDAASPVGPPRSC